MPQLDIMSFITQINWLIITFSIILLINSNILTKVSLKKWLRVIYLKKSGTQVKKSNNNVNKLI